MPSSVSWLSFSNVNSLLYKNKQTNKKKWAMSDLRNRQTWQEQPRCAWAGEVVLILNWVDISSLKQKSSFLPFLSTVIYPFFLGSCLGFCCLCFPQGPELMASSHSTLLPIHLPGFFSHLLRTPSLYVPYWLQSCLSPSYLFPDGYILGGKESPNDSLSFVIWVESSFTSLIRDKSSFFPQCYHLTQLV